MLIDRARQKINKDQPRNQITPACQNKYAAAHRHIERETWKCMSDLKMTGRDRKQDGMREREAMGPSCLGGVFARSLDSQPPIPLDATSSNDLLIIVKASAKPARLEDMQAGFHSLCPHQLTCCWRSCYLELFALDRPGVSGSGFISVQSLPEYLDEAAELRGTGIDTGWLPVSSGTEGASAG